MWQLFETRTGKQRLSSCRETGVGKQRLSNSYLKTGAGQGYFGLEVAQT